MSICLILDLDPSIDVAAIFLLSLHHLQLCILLLLSTKLYRIVYDCHRSTIKNKNKTTCGSTCFNISSVVCICVTFQETFNITKTYTETFCSLEIGEKFFLLRPNALALGLRKIEILDQLRKQYLV